MWSQESARIRRPGGLASLVCSAAFVLAVNACAADEASPDPARQEPMASQAPSTDVPEVPLLADGSLAPGRYRHTLRFECEEGDTIGCPPGLTPPPPLELEITVPDGWEAATDFRLLYPADMGGVADAGGATNGPDGAGLVIGWTNFHVGLNSDPCSRNHDGHLVPDIPVGPTVDDFVNAVVDHPVLDVSRPKRVAVGGFRGRFFTLTGPADLSDCDDWRPWDPGFYVQGPDNHWDVWVVDVDGARLVIVAQYFPRTSERIITQLGAMVKSIGFPAEIRK